MRLSYLLALLLFALLAVTRAPVRAGDRELEVMIVDLTPQASRDADQKQCLAQFTKGMRAEARVTVLAEADFRKRTNKLDAADPFLGWWAKDLEAARVLDSRTAMDSIVLVDCRPAEKRLELLIAPNAVATVRMRLAGRALSAARIATVAAGALRYSWVSFVP